MTERERDERERDLLLAAVGDGGQARARALASGVALLTLRGTELVEENAHGVVRVVRTIPGGTFVGAGAKFKLR